MSPMQQLLIVAGALISLPFAVKLLWKLYLFPLASGLRRPGCSGPNGQRQMACYLWRFWQRASSFSSALGGCVIG